MLEAGVKKTVYFIVKVFFLVLLKRLIQQTLTLFYSPEAKIT